ncbi:hypothetical protein CLOBOL_00621 [Enterocloster bolteae ATCC BAA-613]|uniref:Uncharacterized protein n=1 Tax=Enterocloster bolteae (strain ATCC BAA-613 / DSM 15670 / CCUG 46953 / JCM 12243 / WAL 16351) TaxID=411902 RepID=A8RI80_ENTBW|nr:hypothetical protein CLOBOL_00621 [Enterocloster bolteae ATCC BAA-613]
MCADRFGICSTKIQSGNMPAYISGKETSYEKSSIN